MEELTLFKEFEFFKLNHMYNILLKRMTKYYEDLQNTGVVLPECMIKDSPEKLAKTEMSNLLANNSREHFYELYEKAYHELAERGEI